MATVHKAAFLLATPYTYLWLPPAQAVEVTGPSEASCTASSGSAGNLWQEGQDSSRPKVVTRPDNCSRTYSPDSRKTYSGLSLFTVRAQLKHRVEIVAVKQER